MSTPETILANFAYAAIGGLLMLAGGWLAHQLFNRAIGFNVNAELKAGNVAVGLALMAIFLATGIGGGLVIGLALH